MIKDNQNYNDNVEPNTAFLNELKNKLPEYFNKDGEFDLEKFKYNLKSNDINELKDGYQLDFIGKDYARRQSGEIPKTIVVPDEEQNNGEGKNSSNLFFTGDNIEVLRHLQGAYENSIDVIYIDPPYNTGSNDFVYPDHFEYSDEELINIMGLDEYQIQRLKSLQGSSTHSAWLSFMYPRLFMAKKILSDDGLIAISIDDNEYSNLNLLMSEIFGEQNFVTNISWRRTDNQPNIGKIAKVKEYILVYSKNIKKCNLGRIPLSKKAKKEYRYEDEIGKFRRGILLDKTRGRHTYPVKTLSGNILNGPWMITEDKFKKFESDNLIYWTKGGQEQPYKKIYLKDTKGVVPNDFWNIDVGTNQRASDEFISLMGKRYFSFPKPTSLIKRIIQLSGKDSPLILDFFAGSSSTADAVMQLNAEDGNNREFIMVQIPEKTYTTLNNGILEPIKGAELAFNDGYKSIDEISRKRIKKASDRITDEYNLKNNTSFDGSFKHYIVTKPTFTTLDQINDFDVKNISLFQDMVELFSGHSLGLDYDTKGENTIARTWLLEDGYYINNEIEDILIEGYNAKLVNENLLYLINEGWNNETTRCLLNKLGNRELSIQTIVIFGYSFNISELKELEIGLKQLDMNVNLLKRY